MNGQLETGGTRWPQSEWFSGMVDLKVVLDCGGPWREQQA